MTFVIKGHPFAARVDVESLRRVRQLAGIDLIALVRGQVANEMASDPIALCECIYALVKPQADAVNLPQEEFYRELRGDTLAEATSALLEGVADFFPSRDRDVLKKAIAKTAEVKAAMLAESERKIDAIDPSSLTQSLLERSGAPSTSAPASSESNQAA